VATLRIEPATVHGVEPSDHAHDFPVLTYITEGGATQGASPAGSDRISNVRAGDLFVIAPGDVVSLGEADIASARGWAVIFTPEALRPTAPASFLSWRAHPLLFPFVRGGRGVLRLTVPPADRPRWTARITELDRELAERRDGHQEAALALLNLLLVDVSRLAADVVGDLRLNDEPLLAQVFAIIERRYPEPLSLRDVAAAVNLSPGHLTTTVRRRTARTVQDWITERRMTQARRLLVETDLAVSEVGRQVGYLDPGYFARTFRRAHGLSPRRWRQASTRAATDGTLAP
jgi:AraC-like DNA-binding protein